MPHVLLIHLHKWTPAKLLSGKKPVDSCLILCPYVLPSCRWSCKRENYVCRSLDYVLERWTDCWIAVCIKRRKRGLVRAHIAHIDENMEWNKRERKEHLCQQSRMIVDTRVSRCSGISNLRSINPTTPTTFKEKSSLVQCKNNISNVICKLRRSYCYHGRY